MSSASKQLRKKRRMNPDEEHVPILPGRRSLVNPEKVPKNSKEPKREMYPRTAKLNSHSSSSSPSFTSASRLLRSSHTQRQKYSQSAAASPKTSKLHRKRQTPKCHVNEAGSLSDSSDATMPAADPVTFAPCKTQKPDYKSIPEHSGTVHVKKVKNTTKIFIPANLNSRITKFFKPSISKREAPDDSCKDFAIPSCSSAGTESHSYLGKRRKKTYNSISSIDGSQNDVKSAELKNEIFFKKYQNCYGLFGDSGFDVDENLPNYFEQLPNHVLELIFCQIPFRDLMQYRRVCSRWNEVIDDKNFMEWKKVYFKLKGGRCEALRQMHVLCKLGNNRRANDCFPVLLKFLSENFRIKASPDMCTLLSTCTKGEWAEKVITERYPEMLTKDSKGWCLLACAIILSETTEDIYTVYKSLDKVNARCCLKDVTNAMYCILTFFLYFKLIRSFNHGLHYRLYNALYWIENTLPNSKAGGQSLRILKGLPGQQSIRSYCNEGSNSTLTYEQLRILNHRFQPKQVLKIVALAGTGKTTTLVHLAKLYPQVKFLTIMFNKSVCEEATKRFPRNVTCKTAHSLAYAAYGHRLRYKLVTRLRPHDLIDLVENPQKVPVHIHIYCKLVLDTINSFIISPDPEISSEHVPSDYTQPYAIATNLMEEEFIAEAKVVWNKMISTNTKHKAAKITHDVYLKLYQLSHPTFTNYQFLMVDEAQDCNPVMLDIVLSQNLPAILVGDPNQQIYGFRGARNALDAIEATHTYYLTKSFRFGTEVSYIASICLEVLNDIHKETIVGCKQASFTDGTVHGQFAIIARTNGSLFNEAVRICCHKELRSHEPSTIHGCFAGGLQGYGFDQILDISNLYARQEGDPAPRIKNKFISRFKTYKDLSNYVKLVDDSDLMSKIQIVKRYGHHIPDYLKMIKEACSHPLELANIVFTTAHKSKGLEFDTVSLTDDYEVVTSVENFRRPRPANDEENNILYVAVTRAKKSLLLPERLLSILLTTHEKFEFPEMVSGEPKPSLQCANCNHNFQPHTVLVLRRRRMITNVGRIIKGGYLCMTCGTHQTFRPRLSLEPVIVYLDPIPDYFHQAMTPLVGPLPNDPPLTSSNDGVREGGVYYVVGF